MSRGRELSKVGGLTQTIAGISTFVGISTFASDVRIHGKLDVDGDITYDEMTAVNSKVTGVSTVTDIRVDRNINVAGIATVTGALDANGGATIDNIQIGVTGDNEIDTASGNLTIDSAGGTVTIDDAAAITGNLTVTGNTVLNGTIDLGDATSDTITPTARFDAALVPASDGAIDLGTSALEYRDLYIDGTANIDSLVADTADINGGTADNVVIGGSTAAAGSFTTVAASSNATITGNLDVDGDTTLDTTDVAGTLTVVGNAVVDNVTVNGNTVSTSSGGLTLDSTSGTTTIADALDVTGGTTTTALNANGDVNLGDATSDTITCTGRFDAALVPATDNAIDLGTSSLEYKDLYLDGTANIDSLVADTADINGGTVDGATIGANSASTGAFTTISASGNVDFNGDLDVDGTANLDVVDIDGAVDMASNLVIAGNIDANGNLDVDGTTDLDTTNVVGTLTVTGDIAADNVTVNGNTVSTSSGNLTLDSAGGTVSVADNLTVSGNFTVNGTTNTVNSTTVTIADKNFQVATGSADDSVADGGGLTVDSGDGDKTWNFEATGDNWGSNQNINAASGKVYKINNTSVLSATTLGSGVVNSSLTTLGTIATGVWQGTAIANGYLANSTVSYGGVSLALGASDATPAFDLQDATGYPTSSLTGTITNAQLAGSIANAKLSNSTVSYGGVSLALGASDATPAFNLTDATNYPTSSLSGTITNAQLAGSIADSKLNTISTAGKVDLASLEIDGGTDIGADLVDADLFIVDDGAGGTNRKTTGTRIKKYIWSSASGDATASDSGAITLANSGVTAATIGSGSAIPILTIDAKGRITNTSTAAIDSTAISQGNTNVTVTDSGTGSIVASVDGTTRATISGTGIAITGNITGTGTASISGGELTLGTADSSSGHVNAYENMTFNLDTDNDDTNRYFAFYKNGSSGSGTELFKVEESGQASITGNLDVSSGVDVTGNLTVSGTSTFTGNTTHNGNIIGDGSTNLSSINEVAAASLDISGSADIDGTLEADAITVDGTALNEYIADTVGAMVSSNTETNITVTYQDADNTLDFVVATLNQDTTGNAATATALETGRTIGMTGDVTWTSASFDGTGNVTGSATLAASGVTAATYGSSTALPVLTVDAKGRITSATTTAIDSTTISNGGGSVAVGSGGDITVTGDTTFVNHATFGDDDELRFGAGTDGTIHSDGANWMIQGSANGITYVRGSTLNLSANGGSGGYNGAVLIAKPGAGVDERVQLKYGANVRLTTTSSGLTLGGTVTGTFSGNITGDVTGDVTGNADTATLASSSTISANNSTDETVYPVFVDGATGTQGLESDTGFTYNPSSGTLTSSVFVGNLTGDVTGNTSGSSGSCTGNAATATLASTSTITANNSTDETVYPVFVDGATGSQGLESDTGLSYNPSSGLLTIGGELDAASLDISGNADIDGTCEADAYTVNGTALSTYIAGITVTNASTAANAQLLDSLDSTQFLRSDTSDTFTGTLTVSGAAAVDNLSLNGNTLTTSSGNLTIDSSGGTVSVADNLTISGNLTVNGTTTTVDTTNTNISDNLIELNSGAGSNANDSGIIIERGSTGDNAIIAWDESADKFTVGTTTATNDATGNISITTGTLVANIEGNVTGNVTGNTSGSSGSCTGNAATATLATNVTATANNGTNETVYPTFVDSSAGGSQGIETDSGLSYNPSTNALSTTEFIGGLTGNVTGNTSGSSGSCTGNAATATKLATARTIGGTSFDGTGNIAVALSTQATNVTASANNSTNETVYPTFVDGATGAQGIETDTGLTYNPSSGTLTSSVFVGSLTGNVTGNTSGSSGSCTGTAALATSVTVSANNTANETVYPTFVDGATGTQGCETDTALTYNPSSNTLTAGTFSGSLSGTASNASQLDSLDSSQFVRSDTADTMTATFTCRAITPQSDSTYNLGTNSVRWANIYGDDIRTGDLHLSNEHLDNGNSIDGSWGSYQIEEGEDNLFITNKRSGKKYRFVLQEV